MNQYEKALEAVKYIKSKTNVEAKIGLILGSGLGSITDDIDNSVVIPFAEIPYFEVPTTVGHHGAVVIGKLNGVDVVALSGRYHFYEGYSLEIITFPIRVMHLLGIKTLIITNACGAINTAFKPGDLMVISDHINLVSNNPLIGKNNDEFGTRFPDASEIYTKALKKIAHQTAKELGYELQEGVYAWWTGPSYETPAEIKMIRILGADAVGMSTVPEALVASHMDMQVLGISCLTNMASGILDQKLSHEEVIQVVRQVNGKFQNLVKNILTKI
ncbi:MAG: purine-nucleoside phosphorylase [Acholeplasmataceae bacterium]|nr:purine-nucleoside phosphorylase [Acholeplasmataceae bacterium]